MHQKHISMELTADGARVTNLRLDGGKLVLTIEAELADSHLSATDGGESSTEMPAHSFPPPAEEIAPPPQTSPIPPSPSSSTGRPAPDMGIFTLTTPEPAPQIDMPVSSFNQSGFAAAPAPIPDEPPMFAETPVAPDRPTRPVEQPKPISFGDPLGVPPAAPAVGPAVAPAISMEQVPQPFMAPHFEPENNSFIAPAPAPALDMANPFASPPAMQSPAPSFGISPLAAAEESSVFGGARHGEPQPALSFGQELPEQPAAAPQPAFAPGIGIGFGAEPAPAPAPAPAMSAVPGLSLGAEFLPPQQPQPGFAAQPEPVPPPAPAPEPLPQPMQAAQPQPLPPSAPAPAAPEEKQRPAAGGTTVLIRYTCPKCKTQGMQAVDKVGTVVNCSNCGKAMRLVMKK